MVRPIFGGQANSGVPVPILANGPPPPHLGPPDRLTAGPPLRRTAQNSHFFQFPFSFSFCSLRMSSRIFSSLWKSFRRILVVFWSVRTSNVLVFALGLTQNTTHKHNTNWPKMSGKTRSAPNNDIFGEKKFNFGEDRSPTFHRMVSKTKRPALRPRQHLLSVCDARLKKHTA